MFDKSFAQWWLSRVEPFRDVPPEKLAADRESMERQQEFNQHYQTFLQTAVLPVIDALTKFLRSARVVHRISSWGNQISVRIHLAWRWGEMVVSQSHEDGRGVQSPYLQRGRETHGRFGPGFRAPLRSARPLPPTVAAQELHFFLGRMVQDLIDSPPPPEIPPGEKPVE